jgi:hypothetical protein
MNQREQCHADCWSGRRCTLQLKRRWRPSIIWTALAWIGINRRHHERRNGWDRRARASPMYDN